ncbi:unnamed protein product [Ixodes hexagonus]
MGKKDKKKGKGAEKTIAKTEKKAAQKLKKTLAAKGEDDIQKLISQFVEQGRRRLPVSEELVEPPSFRSGATLCAHPEKEQLLLFGGEYYNGLKTFMYNELYLYNIKKNNWLLVKCPNPPPPRCAHQAMAVPQGGGQMWLFGGEFASPTRSQFYHYKDLWVYHLASRSWEQVHAPGGPSARSGHRMVQLGRRLIVFGGFHESIRDYHYFNDVYSFDLDERKWTKMEPVNAGPCPRSGCQMFAMSDDRIVVYGGYSREKLKKDVDHGVGHTDMYILHLDSGAPGKCKWAPVKQTGARLGPRSGLSTASVPQANRAYLFGGVQDEEDEEALEGRFFNDLHQLELDRGHWRLVQLRGESRDRGAKDGQLKEDMEEEAEEGIHRLSIREPVVTSDDGVFTVTIGASKGKTSGQDEACAGATASEPAKDVSVPIARMGCCMVVKHSILYLYGGTFEDGDRQFTLSDMYALDTHKLDQWKVLVPLDTKTQEWLGSDESDDEDSDDDDDDDDSDEDMEADDDGDGQSKDEAD